MPVIQIELTEQEAELLRRVGLSQIVVREGESDWTPLADFADKRFIVFHQSIGQDRAIVSLTEFGAFALGSLERQDIGDGWDLLAVRAAVLHLFNHERHLDNTIAKLKRRGTIDPLTPTWSVIKALQTYAARKQALAPPKFKDEGFGDEDDGDLGFGGV